MDAPQVSSSLNSLKSLREDQTSNTPQIPLTPTTTSLLSSLPTPFTFATKTLTNTCRFLDRYYCGSPPTRLSIFLDTLRLTICVLLTFALIYSFVYIVAYFERKKILRELYKRRGAQRHDVLMGMFERMGWSGYEVREWKAGREGVEIRDLNAGREREWEGVHLA
ncbi:hypothetical protein N431DRAFT_415961 [Stipitochalara longipes BDJ]|nr:hypothetical protein N431DRAFT_415961 [Stipitochalara longipes BDJ]